MREQDEPTELFAYTVQVLDDDQPQRADAIYLYGETDDNRMPVIDTGLLVAKLHPGAAILIAGGSERSGYAGSESWRSELIGRGLAPGRIEVVPPPQESILHTRNESQAMLAHCSAREYVELILVAPTFHLPRAFLTVLSVLRQERHAQRIYAHAAQSRPWSREVIHSQGVLRALRRDLLASEYERIIRYRESGDLLKPRDALAYFAARS